MARNVILCLVIYWNKKPAGSIIEIPFDNSSRILTLKQKVKEVKPHTLKDVVEPDLLVVWRCKDRSIVLKDNTFEDQIEKIFSDDEAEKLDAITPIADLGITENETLLVQLPRRISPSGSSSRSDVFAAPGLHQTFYNKSWGKRWPTRKGTIKGIHVAVSDHSIGTDDLHSSDIHDDATSNKEYTCLIDIDFVARACQISPYTEDFIVVRDEYITLRKALEEKLEKHDWSFVLTGHLGIGKTVFLVYLLLYRLEMRLPTAVQFQSKHYILYDAKGAHIRHHTNHYLPKSCWAFTDSSVYIKQPCQGFLTSRVPVIHATSPRPETWKDWHKYARVCSILIMDVTKQWEMAAIAQELGFDPSYAITLMDKWGPCIRTIVKILYDPSFAQELAILGEKQQQILEIVNG